MRMSQKSCNGSRMVEMGVFRRVAILFSLSTKVLYNFLALVHH